MRPTLIIWAIVIIIFVIVSRICNSSPQADNDNNYNTPNRPYVAGAP